MKRKTGYYFTQDAKGWCIAEQRKTVKENPLHALETATGDFCWVVSFIDEEDLDFLSCFNAEDILRQFACECALDVIHLWKPPEVVLNYLRTRDEKLRIAARDAAWDAAWDGARAAACAAAWAAASAAASAAVSAAAWDGARAAAEVAAEVAAWANYSQKLREMLNRRCDSEEKADQTEPRSTIPAYGANHSQV